MSASDTPRTELEVYVPMKPIEDEWVPDFEYVSADFARSLELECAALAAANEQLAQALEEMVRQIEVGGSFKTNIEAFNAAKSALARHRCQPHAKPDGRKEKDES
jgi:hypothetical protein